MTRPEAIVEVQPTQIATYTAIQWLGFDDADAIAWMCERFGWTNLGTRDRMGKTTLVILGRNKKRYWLTHGDWILALGANGSLAVVTDRKFRTDYKITDRGVRE